MNRAAISVAVLLGAHAAAQAAGAGCTRDDIQQAGNQAPAGERAKNIRTIEERLAACKGKLTQDEEAAGIELLFRFTREPLDAAECRRVLRPGLVLTAASARERLDEGWGYCGGDCAQAPLAASCQSGRQRREREVDPKLGPGFENEQPVACDLAAARKTIERLDRAGFRDQALRFLTKLRTSCAPSLDRAARDALANDEALLQFHRDDDAACLRVLADPTDKVSPARAFNRALCGAPCDAAAPACQAGAAARRKALAARPMRAKLEAKTHEVCWSCKPGGPCSPPTHETLGRQPAGTYALDWDLKQVREISDSRVQDSRKVFWAGDLNGDGVGDLVFFETGPALWHACPDQPENRCSFPVKDLTVAVGCGADGDYRPIFQVRTSELEDGPDDLSKLDRFSAAVTAPPGTAVKTVCLYPGKAVHCTRSGCDREPERCADLSAWQALEKH